ncbi:Thiamine monophosphate synthase [Macrophomina phaseolina MS6]|uniref:Thiamine monophosphate synthase n=1 Tax=Macrophomina phaseolina (strain MS6) TaxID=1126212 RepID=K2RL95_MACPH|nr:Thiamine monophosphate synthase [Macrophomina phaseolina MS6]
MLPLRKKRQQQSHAIVRVNDLNAAPPRKKAAAIAGPWSDSTAPPQETLRLSLLSIPPPAALQLNHLPFFERKHRKSAECRGRECLKGRISPNMKDKIDYSLYLVTDNTPAILRGRDLVSVVRAAVEGGVTIVQLRDKTSDTATLVKTAKQLYEVTRGYNVPLLVNDRVDVALAAGVDGVHIGQDDMGRKTRNQSSAPPASARSSLLCRSRKTSPTSRPSASAASMHPTASASSTSPSPGSSRSTASPSSAPSSAPRTPRRRLRNFASWCGRRRPSTCSSARSTTARTMSSRSASLKSWRLSRRRTRSATT